WSFPNGSVGEPYRLRDDVRQGDLPRASIEGVREAFPSPVLDPFLHDRRAEYALCVQEVGALHDRHVEPEELVDEPVLDEEVPQLVLAERVVRSPPVLLPVVLVDRAEDDLPAGAEVAGRAEDDRLGEA